MFGLISRKTYLFIAFGVALVLFLIGLFFGKDIAGFADSLALQMPSDTMANVARFIVQPIKLVMLNPLPGGIMAGLLWPLIFLEILLVIFLLILAVAAQVRPTTPL